MRREEVFQAILAGKKTQQDGAKLLGISRQRVGHLYRKWKTAQGRPVPPSVPSAPAPSPSGPDPLDAVFTPGKEPEQKPSSEPRNVEDVLRPVGERPDVPTPPPPSNPLNVDAKPFEPRDGQSDIERIDPEDASAGRELVSYGTRLLREFAARKLRVKEEEAAKENEFLRVAMKRNSEKFHLLGWLTKGWKGLVIGGILDVVRMALLAPVAPVKRDVEPEAPAPRAADPVDPDQPTSIGEEPEAPAPKRPTLAEKIEKSRGH